MAPPADETAAPLPDEAAGSDAGLRTDALRRLGITGTEDAPALRDALARSGVGIYPAFALGILALVDQFQGFAFGVLTPEMSRALGLSVATIAGIRTLQALTAAVAPLPMAALTQNRPRRALLSILTALGWSIVTIGNGLVSTLGGLALILVGDGLLSGSAVALHRPLLMDSYPPETRVRLMSVYGAFATSASIVAPALVALCVSVFDLTWRGVFVAFGSISLLGSLMASGLRDPGFGRWDTERVRDTVRTEHGSGGPASDVELGFFEITRRLMLIPTVRRTAIGFLVFGILLIPYTTFLSFFLEERWGLGPSGRGLVFAFTSAAGIAGLAALGGKGEAMFRKDPGRLLDVTGIILAGAVVAIMAAAAVPSFVGMLLLFAAAQALFAPVAPLLSIVQLSVVEARWRPHLSALMGIFLGAGSFAGVFLLSGVERRFGLAGAMISLMIPGVAGALIIRTARSLVADDFDRLVTRLIDEEQVERIKEQGQHLPLLSCRRIDFSYGQLQVLFEVDFTVDDGEMVALLGTNGAGKSTLLKVISGIALPSNGSVRYRGEDITYLDAERRVRLGISQIPGGHAVFPGMTVIENLRGYGYTLGRDRRAIDAAIERSLVTFPKLAERRNAPARTLSGGEQQMLGLSKALILRPRLLLIDELSLGLAPVIVEQLLELVRTINADGTAVVLVEQSVNVALSVVDHAYFMEKGQIRFDGSSTDLVQRDDLLRAVFLHGIAEGTGQ